MFSAFLWFHVQVIMHASMIEGDGIRHGATSVTSRTRWGGGRKCMVRKAGCLLRALQQDHGVGIQSLGLTELPCVVLVRQGLWAVSTGSWLLGWKPSIVLQAVLVTLHSVPFVFSSKWWWKLLQTFCRSCLGRQFWFSANSSGEQACKCSVWWKGQGEMPC